jgi:hypothetical protein
MTPMYRSNMSMRKLFPKINSITLAKVFKTNRPANNAHFYRRVKEPVAGVQKREISLT